MINNKTSYFFEKIDGFAKKNANKFSNHTNKLTQLIKKNIGTTILWATLAVWSAWVATKEIVQDVQAKERIAYMNEHPDRIFPKVGQIGNANIFPTNSGDGIYSMHVTVFEDYVKEVRDIMSLTWGKEVLIKSAKEDPIGVWYFANNNIISIDQDVHFPEYSGIQVQDNYHEGVGSTLIENPSITKYTFEDETWIKELVEISTSKDVLIKLVHDTLGHKADTEDLINIHAWIKRQNESEESDEPHTMKEKNKRIKESSLTWTSYQKDLANKREREELFALEELNKKRAEREIALMVFLWEAADKLHWSAAEGVEAALREVASMKPELFTLYSENHTIPTYGLMNGISVIANANIHRKENDERKKKDKEDQALYSEFQRETNRKY